jgi:hypothetical protein
MPVGAIYVGRPSPWGSPFPVDADWMPWAAVGIGYKADPPGRAAASVAFYRQWLTGEASPGPLATARSDDALEYANGVIVDTATVARGMAAGFALLMSRNVVIPPAPSIEAIRAALRGHDLACWCGLDQPCHGNVLLEIANG